MLCLFNNLNVCLTVVIKFKSRFRRRNWKFQTIRCRTVSILARMKASLMEPFDCIAPICMIVSGKAWLGWLLHCPLITISLPWCHIVIHICLVMSMHFLSIILDMLNAWVIGLWKRYLVLGFGWGRVSATVGVRLLSSAIVVIDLSRRVCWGLRTMVVLTSHLTLVRTTTRPYMGRA
jgi:hypothetical protein